MFTSPVSSPASSLTLQFGLGGTDGALPSSLMLHFGLDGSDGGFPSSLMLQFGLDGSDGGLPSSLMLQSGLDGSDGIVDGIVSSRKENRVFCRLAVFCTVSTTLSMLGFLEPKAS